MTKVLQHADNCTGAFCCLPGDIAMYTSRGVPVEEKDCIDMKSVGTKKEEENHCILSE